MKKSTLMALTLSLAMFVGLSTAAHAQNYYGGNPPLTQEQRVKADKLFSEHMNSIAPIQQQYAAKRAELDALMFSGSADTAKIEALSKELGELDGKLYSEQTKFRAKLANENLPAYGYGARQGYGRGGMKGQGYGRGGMNGPGYGHGRGGGMGNGYGHHSW